MTAKSGKNMVFRDRGQLRKYDEVIDFSFCLLVFIDIAR